MAVQALMQTEKKTAKRPEGNKYYKAAGGEKHHELGVLR